jgi:hypothetical protein
MLNRPNGVRGHSVKTRWDSENFLTRRLECDRLQDFEARGCRLARLAHRGEDQARYQACCEGRLQRTICAVEVCYLALVG